jgi:peptidoglycan/LPS O-acetylase OafA/YrhL
MENGLRKINSIQALRGLAAMLVVMFHFRGDLALTFPSADKLLGCGSIGVDLFFMISGFIAYYITANENEGYSSSKIFLLKRLCRILPPYIIATLFVAGKSWDAWQITLRSFMFLPRDAAEMAPYFGYAKLNVGWTLNYEFAFYVLCATCMLFKRYKFILLSLVISFLVMLTYLTSDNQGGLVNINYGYPGYLSLITNGMMLEFLCGILIGYITLNQSLPGSKIAWKVALFLSASYFFYVSAGFSSTPGNGHYDFVSASFLILLVVTSYEAKFGLNPPKLLTLIGTVSFSVYLMHKRGMSVASKIIYSFYHGHFAGLMATLAALFLTALFSIVFYRYIEVKLCTFLRNKLLRSIYIPQQA